MSFRLFIYYCTLAGAGSALAGWALGRFLTHGDGLLVQGLKGLYLGLALALALALVDSLWNLALSRIFSIFARVVAAVLVGGMAGLLGGLVGEALHQASGWDVFIVPGYTLVGMLIGLSVGVFDLVSNLAFNQEAHGAIRKVKSGLIGGTLGGILGGSVSLLLRSSWSGMFVDKSPELLWSPSATAFAALGACIGLMIGLTQVVLKQAWIRVEQGFRAGREQILARDEIIIGRAENCDVGLFGDPGVDKVHARIYRQGDEFFLDDACSSTGTYVNDRKLTGPHALRSGDLIRVGRCLLRFGERTKKRMKDEG